MPKLVLFDIDGTLIRDDGAAREAFAEAIREVFDYEEPLARFDFSGRTDPQITFMILEETGIEKDRVEQGLESLWTHYLAGLEKRVSRECVHVMPGVERLLDALEDHGDVTLALLTGNIEPGARIKLSPHDLNRYFPFGAFGSDSPRREDLPPIAVARAEQHNGQRFAERDVVIIGDSIYDVRCGVPHGAKSIAVATGVTAAEKLRAEHPDYFFDTLEDVDRVVEAVMA